MASKTAKPRARSAGGSRKPAKPVVAAAQDEGEWKTQQGEVGIRVRMYRVGFGDFFLLSFRDADQHEEHVIVDCGVFKGTSQTGDIDSISAAVADMVATTGQQVALIIMTHRHADHIAGFARCKAQFEQVTVGGVWMPIWESEFESTAVRFQAELTQTAMALQSSFASLGANASAEQSTARRFMENATGLDAQAAAKGATAAKGSNASALALLKHGLKGVTAAEYYKAGDVPKLPRALKDIGVTAEILGPPPISDLALMKLMDLKKGVGQYLADARLTGGDERAPFPADWEVDSFEKTTAPLDSHYPPESMREWLDPREPRKFGLDEALNARTRMEAALSLALPATSLTAAKLLNSFLNNQSLVVLFGFKGKKLLFVGDAQAGNWEHWLFDTDEPDKLASGSLSSRAKTILTSIDFYKIGHHGSSNATPRIVAETIAGHGPACMCSTQKDVYGTEDPDDPTKGTEVPRIPLMDKLASTKAMVRSDQIEIRVAERTVAAEVNAALPSDRPGRRYRRGSLWIDCFL